MRDYVEVEIEVNSLLISDLHETITSVIAQVDKNRLNFHLLFSNSSNLDISEEIKRLAKNNIKVVQNHTNARFLFKLHSGEIISPSFLYKGVHFLKNNCASFVCPEYCFQRIENTLVIATIANEQMLFGKTRTCLIDKQKISNSESNQPLRASIIKDTCSALPTTNDDYYKYIYKTKTNTHQLTLTPFTISDVKTTYPSKLFNVKNQSKSFKNKIKTNLIAITGRSKIAKKILSLDDQKDEPLTVHSNVPPYISNTMREELHQLSQIKYGLKGYESMRFIDLTFETFYKSESIFNATQEITNKFEYDHYSYIMILPWLISGGIDLFATNYLRSISELEPKENILVFLTNSEHKSYTKEELKLPSNITLINLPTIFKTSNKTEKLFPQILYSVISTLNPKRIHIIASKAGYECIEKFGDIFRQNNTSIIFSSYNYLIGPNGEYMGYTVQELPNSYRVGDIVTTDNQKSKDLWVNHFGFIAKDILVHNQLFNYQIDNMPQPSSTDGIRILWAAHVRPEKNPEILPLIAEKLQKDKIQIDCYGLFSPINWSDGNNPLETNLSNLHYKGAYRNFFKDIDLKQYDLFLYTSHSDGTPNVIIEAALSGLPIVASNIGGIGEALQGKALLVDDTCSAEQFVKAIRKTLENKTQSIENAHELQQRLQQKHSKTRFTEQVKEMLKRSQK